MHAGGGCPGACAEHSHLKRRCAKVTDTIAYIGADMKLEISQGVAGQGKAAHGEPLSLPERGVRLWRSIGDAFVSMRNRWLLRLYNLANRLDADVIDDVVIDQIAAQTLQRPARVVQP